jgi:hypothetical protein
LGAIQLGDVPIIGRPGDQDYLMLDLPFLRLQEDVQKFSDIEKLFADMNPIIKTPMELKAHEQFFSGIPLSDTRMENAPFPATLPGVSQLLQAAGWAEKDQEGRLVMSDAHSYAMSAMNPMTSRIERLQPTQMKNPGDPGYDREREYVNDKSVENLLSILGGVTVRTNAPERQQGEMLRRSRELKTLLDEAKNSGYLKG